MTELTQQQIDTILDSSFDDHFWLFQIGVFTSAGGKETGDHGFNFPFYDRGSAYWKAIGPKLYQLLCDKEQLCPNKWSEELLSGDLREMIVLIVSAIVAQFDLAISLAVALVALLLKQGVGRFCAVPPE